MGANPRKHHTLFLDFVDYSKFLTEMVLQNDWIVDITIAVVPAIRDDLCNGVLFCEFLLLSNLPYLSFLLKQLLSGVELI